MGSSSDRPRNSVVYQAHACVESLGVGFRGIDVYAMLPYS